MDNSSVERLKRLDRWRALFRWLYWVYPKAKGLHFAYLALSFFPQKVLRINGRVPWPVHFTSRILYPENVRLGRNCSPGFSPGCYIQARNGIEFGDDVYIAPNVGIVSADHDMTDFGCFAAAPPIRIGSRVWIGMSTVILPGVTIGSRVVIGAGSIVTKDVPDGSVAVGNPCRVIRKLTHHDNCSS